MPLVNYDPESEDFRPDEDTPLKAPATTKAERREALDHWLAGVWRNKDIGCIERVDTRTRHGWRMYRYREN